MQLKKENSSLFRSEEFSVQADFYNYPSPSPFFEPKTWEASTSTTQGQETRTTSNKTKTKRITKKTILQENLSPTLYQQMTPPQQRMPQNSFRGLVIYFIVTMFLLYILYSNLLLKNNHKDCPVTNNLSTKIELPSNYSPTTSSSSKSEKAVVAEKRQVELVAAPSPANYHRYDTELKHIAFGIAASSNLWEIRKEYIKAWWKPNETRGVVWMDKKVRTKANEGLPEIRVSQDTSNFKYLNRQGSRSALRISRVVSETLKLGLKDIRWFVMGDDDTVFVVENVVRVLSKYDHTQFYYVGSASESHIQNILFSYAMAFGGGGFAISYPLAKELAKMQDKCIQRYPALYGSDDRIQACMAELGVPLSRELGFHQVKLPFS